MGVWNSVRRAFAWSLGGSTYDAVQSKNKRSAPTGILRSEDAELTQADRKKMLSASRTLHRNFAVAAWMIRKHLDYVSTFSFQARTGNDALDESLEKLVRWWGQPANFDVTGRFSLPRFTRLAEMRRTVDGDMGILKLNSALVQAIEGDRVRTPIGGLPADYSAADFIHGVRTNAAGRPLEYCICKRGATNDSSGAAATFQFERIIPARNLYHFGYFDRFDQVRGISPLATAVNTLRDTYEGFDYALAKMKVAQMFGLVFYREATEMEEHHEEVADTLGATSTSSEDGTGYEVDFGRGPIKLDLDPGDRAEFLEAKSPSTEFQAFSQTMVGVALKALDIPYSFYAENFTNYSGARQALLQYEQSAKIKRADVQAMLDHLTAWRVSLWIQDGVLPNVALTDVRWDWIPSGVPWIDPLKEINADIAAIGAGLSSRTRRLKEQGIDFYELVDELAAEQKYLIDKGLAPALATTDPELMGVANA
jgi:capsid protein